jgi:hypothetical protein
MSSIVLVQPFEQISTKIFVVFYKKIIQVTPIKRDDG